MADWFTPIQRLKAKETTWMKLEKSNKPLEGIPEQERLYYYGKRQHAECKFEYDLFFDTSGILDPKSKKDTAISQEQILYNIYKEEISRRVPLVTSHLYGHWLQDIEGRPLGNHKKVENKSDYRRTGLPLDKTIGLPKSTNELFLE